MTNNSNLITGLIAGALIGTAIGILFAPKPGKETRQVVGSKAVDFRDKAGTYVGNIREKIRRSRETDGAEEHSDNGVRTFS